MAIKITIPKKRMFHIDYANALPDRGGIYLFYDESREQLLYVGKAKNLKQRVKIHMGNKLTGPDRFGSSGDINHNFRWVEVFCVDCPAERDIYETYLINTLKPPLNVGKVFLYESSRYQDKYKTSEFIKAEADASEREFIMLSKSLKGFSL